MPPRSSPPPPGRAPAPPPSGGKNVDSMLVDVAIAVIVLLVVIAAIGSFMASVTGSYVGLIGWFYSRNWRLFYIVTALIVGILDIILLVCGGFIIKRFNALHEKIPQQEIVSHMISPQQEFQQNWQEIQLLIVSESPSDWNMAILRADAQLEDALDHLGYEGETMAERLKIVDPTRLKSLDRVWSAHRLRNAIAHDPLQQLTRETLSHALQSYALAFKELGFLEEAA